MTSSEPFPCFVRLRNLADKERSTAHLLENRGELRASLAHHTLVVEHARDRLRVEAILRHADTRGESVRELDDVLGVARQETGKGTYV